ncbi:protein of unknown function [Serratia sp. Tan611]|nr:protein of unknown function [Serratia sp. Tan611]
MSLLQLSILGCLTELVNFPH